MANQQYQQPPAAPPAPQQPAQPAAPPPPPGAAAPPPGAVPAPAYPAQPPPGAQPAAVPGPAYPAPVPGQQPAAVPAPAYPTQPEAYPAAYPAQPAAAPMDLGQIAAGIAAATVGITRYPYLNAEPGEYVIRVVKTLLQEQSASFVMEADIVESTRPDVRSPDMRVSWVQAVTGNNPAMVAARQGALLACILRTAGFATAEEAGAQGWNGEQLRRYINDCLVEPGPLAGRLVRVNVAPSGRVTRQGEVINNVNWAPYG